jgi:hypothetical protein
MAKTKNILPLRTELLLLPNHVKAAVVRLPALIEAFPATRGRVRDDSDEARHLRREYPAIPFPPLQYLCDLTLTIYTFREFTTTSPRYSTFEF